MTTNKTIFDDKTEVRYMTCTMRAAGDASAPVIEGDAAVFGQETVIGSWFREKIRQGAFTRVLSEQPDVIAAFNHDWNVVLGRTTSNTLRLEQTSTALRYSVDVNLADPQAVSVYEKVKRGDVSQSSFAFTVRSEEWTKGDGPNELALREIVEVDQLLDVSPVTFPAYPQTSVSARSKYQQLQEQEPQAASGDADAKAQARRRHLQLLSLNQPKE